MELDHLSLPQLFWSENEASKISSYSQTTMKYGLQVSEQQAVSLLGSCSKALKNTGRIALKPITQDLIEAFYTSPNLSPQNYFETLTELTELFYHYKNETLDAVPDDALIAFMRERFDGVCQGSLELLRDRELYNLAKVIRFGKTIGQKNISDDISPESDDEDPGDLEEEYNEQF